MGCALKGVESKVIVVPWVSSCMGFVPEGTNPILHSAGDLCHSAFIDPANCFTRSHCFSSTNNYGASACCIVEDLFACRCKGLWCGV